LLFLPLPLPDDGTTGGTEAGALEMAAGGDVGETAPDTGVPELDLLAGGALEGGVTGDKVVLEAVTGVDEEAAAVPPATAKSTVNVAIAVR